MDIVNATCVMEPEELKLKNKLNEKLKDVENDRISYVIEQFIHSERDRKILKRRYIDGIHLEPLSVEFDLTAKQIQNIIAKHEAVLFKHL